MMGPILGVLYVIIVIGVILYAMIKSILWEKKFKKASFSQRKKMIKDLNRTLKIQSI